MPATNSRQLRSEDSTALASHTIIMAAPLSAFFNPAAMQPATSFQAVEPRVKRRHMETNGATGALLDEFADFAAVARTCFDERKNEQFGATFFPLHSLGCPLHIWQHNILTTARPGSQMDVSRAGLSLGG
jgi:hypothetical protein